MSLQHLRSQTKKNRAAAKSSKKNILTSNAMKLGTSHENAELT